MMIARIGSGAKGTPTMGQDRVQGDDDALGRFLGAGGRDDQRHHHRQADQVEHAGDEGADDDQGAVPWRRQAPGPRRSPPTTCRAACASGPAPRRGQSPARRTRGAALEACVRASTAPPQIVVVAHAGPGVDLAQGVREAEQAADEAATGSTRAAGAAATCRACASSTKPARAPARRGRWARAMCTREPPRRKPRRRTPPKVIRCGSHARTTMDSWAQA